jgi:hypothetical protein
MWEMPILFFLRRLMRFSFYSIVAALVFVGSSPGLYADVVTAGVELNLGSGWRSGAVAIDIDGDGVLGTDGYAFVRGPLEIVNASYGTLSGNGTSVYNGNGSYALVDDPITTPGGAPTTVFGGTWNPTPGVGIQTSGPIATFTATQDMTSADIIRLGIMIDNLDGSAFNSSAIRVTDSNGGDTGLIDVSTTDFNNLTPDWLFVDITNLSSGDTVDIFGTGGTNGFATIGSLSLDSLTTPEPTTIALWSLLGIGIVSYRRWRRS